jgi:hypothetical protein
MWLAVFPIAPALLWHPEQPVVSVEWSTFAEAHVRVPWHVSHCFVMGIWLRGRPEAFTPLWQLVQGCAAAAAWSKRAGFHALVVWQLSQSRVTVTWRREIPVALMPL